MKLFSGGQNFAASYLLNWAYSNLIHRYTGDKFLDNEVLIPLRNCLELCSNDTYVPLSRLSDFYTSGD